MKKTLNGKIFPPSNKTMKIVDLQTLSFKALPKNKKITN